MIYMERLLESKYHFSVQTTRSAWNDKMKFMRRANRAQSQPDE